jgi:uncharacterized protein YbgA (DUF1722 family)/uncharacterized protein YbbK (DUF523 family)
MEKKFARPKIVCSRCLGFDSCRYDGHRIRSELVGALRPYVDFVKPCPEADIGLGIPRHPVRVLQYRDGLKLIQPSSGLEFTRDMKSFTQEFLNELEDIDGFILKSKSPSCGIGNVKIYGDENNMTNFSKGDGFFGGEILRSFQTKAIEDEMRLLNTKIRDHFLKKTFTFAAFREVEKKGEIKGLIDFQAQNKLLLMSYNQKELRNLGKIVGSHQMKDEEQIFKDYQHHLELAFMKGPTYRSNINVLQHAFGYVSKDLSKEEKTYFLDSLELYREDRAPLQSCISMILSWIIRFKVDYLIQQSFFNPYPRELIMEYEQDRRRKYWE